MPFVCHGCGADFSLDGKIQPNRADVTSYQYVANTVIYGCRVNLWLSAVNSTQRPDVGITANWQRPPNFSYEVLLVTARKRHQRLGSSF